MIDIIIPAYNAKNTIFKTLASIALQTIKDNFKIYIINDASDYDYKEEISFFKNILNIKELTLKTNSGPGVARQYGIDNSYSPYIMFIDSDDVFYDAYAVEKLYNQIVETKCDLIISDILYERDKKREKYSANMVYMHGKIYARQYLIDNHIKFNKSRANEDNGFNNLLLLMEINYKILDDITYIYRENKNSITRKNNREYKFSGLEGYAYNLTWALREAIKRNANSVVISLNSYQHLITFCYYYQIFCDRLDCDKILKWIRNLKEIYIKYRKYEFSPLLEKIENIQYEMFKNTNKVKKVTKNDIEDFLLLID